MRINRCGTKKPISGLAGQGGLTIDEAIAEEKTLAPGSYRIQFNLMEPADINVIKETLTSNGINAYVRQWYSGNLWHLGVSYKKPVPDTGISFLPIAIIPLIAFTIAATIVTIGIFRIKDITDSLTKLALVVGGVMILTLYMSRKSRA